MRYARIEENAMDHPKFIAINAAAWRLWCEGCTYCQKQLTDGFIPDSALRGFRYFTQGALKQLCEALAPGKGPLWHRVDGGVQVHDYFDWNEPREKVLASRKAAKDRLDKWKAEQAAKRGGAPSVTPPPETRCETLRDVAPKQNGTEQERKITGAPRRPVENRTPDEGTFGLYCRIAEEARKISNTRDRDDSISNVAAIFKDLCAEASIDYGSEKASRAIEAVMRQVRAS